MYFQLIFILKVIIFTIFYFSQNVLFWQHDSLQRQKNINIYKLLFCLFTKGMRYNIIYIM